MSTFATGIATIDDQMILRKADDAFHSFIGQDIYAPITCRMYSADTHRFTEALDELRLDKCSKNVVALRIKDYEEIYHWVVITLTKESMMASLSFIISVNIWAMIWSSSLLRIWGAEQAALPCCR